MNYTTVLPLINSSSPCLFPDTLKVVSCSLLLLVAFVAIVENVVFCLAVYSQPRLHRISMVLIVNLSISDIIISCFVPTLEMIFVYYYPSWPLGKWGTNILNCAWAFSVVSPFTTVMAITIERYVAITKESKYITKFTPKFMAGVVMFLWIYSLTWVFFMGYFLKPLHIKRYVWNVNHTFYYVLIWLHLLLPMIAIPVFYHRILRHVRRSRKGLLSACLIHNNKELDIKLTKTVLRVVVTLYLMWLPILGLETLYTSNFSDCAVKKYNILSVLLASSNCCINPIMYSYNNADIREFLGRCRRKLRLCYC